MIVYGDRSERAAPATRLAAIAERLATLPGHGIARHAGLVAAFIALAQLVQGVADAGRDQAGADGACPAEDRLLDALMALARAVIDSWQALVADPSAPPLGNRSLPALLGGSEDLPAEVELKLPEGYAFYALYPEAYALAARQLRLAGPPHVIGIRSIGTGLAAIAAAALGAPRPLTVRPVGHPFDRHIEVAPHAAAALLADPEAHYIIADEGPGLSGSSFAAVARWLERHGVAPERIAFLPSHPHSPGAQASEETRARWEATRKAVVTVDLLVPAERLARWAEPLIGASQTAPVALHDGSRLKYRIEAGGAHWLLKFAGLGEEGERKLALARLLAEAGLIPEVRGLVHGFLVQRWVEADAGTAANPDLIAAAARHLGTRAALLGAQGSQGATLGELDAMARFNIAEGLGPGWAERLPPPAGEPRPYPTDNRCDLAKWLRLADGRILKADALDHHRAHDLIGCQDLAWDVAGAAIEFGLDASRTEAFADQVAAAAGRPVDRALLACLLPCYAAFRLGAARFEGSPREACYALRLRSLLG